MSQGIIQRPPQLYIQVCFALGMTHCLPLNMVLSMLDHRSEKPISDAIPGNHQLRLNGHIGPL